MVAEFGKNEAIPPGCRFHLGFLRLVRDYVLLEPERTQLTDSHMPPTRRDATPRVLTLDDLALERLCVLEAAECLGTVFRTVEVADAIGLVGPSVAASISANFDAHFCSSRLVWSSRTARSDPARARAG